MRWEFANCHNSVTKWYEDYSPTLEIHKCCVEPGNYTLTCYNTKKPMGWKGGYMEFLGHRYCDDFMGFGSSRGIKITEITQGTNISLLSLICLEIKVKSFSLVFIIPLTMLFYMLGNASRMR